LELSEDDTNVSKHVGVIIIQIFSKYKIYIVHC
jgi:chaperonin cofactor prefoldin